jgi:hypothetical protein
MMTDPIYAAWMIPQFGLVVMGSLLLLILGVAVLQYSVLSEFRRDKPIYRILVIIVSAGMMVFSLFRLAGVAITVLQGPELVTSQLSRKIFTTQERGLGNSVLVFETEEPVVLPRFGNLDMVVEGECYHTILYRPPKPFVAMLYRRYPITNATTEVVYVNPLVLELAAASPELCETP